MEMGTTTKAHFSLPAIIAIGAAIASLFVGALGGFILAIVAIIFGVIGILVSMSPSVRGGFVSILSLMIAGFAIVVAVFKALGSVF